MNDLSPNEPERGEKHTPPMTTLTLSAEYKQASHARVDAPQAAGAGRSFGGALAAEGMDDHALLEATRTGDEAAFQELVNRYRNPITNYIYRMLSDYDRAVDLAQETFLRVYTSAERYQANHSFSTYIYRIASNLAITDLRQRKRRRLIPFPSFFDKQGEEVEFEIPDERVAAADETMIDDERRQAVARAIAALPDKYRAAVVLRDVEGRSYEEIGAVLGLSDGTVKSRINRARSLLKERLQGYL
jgi:RNA polymerase sigma-70 factor, ECF subfamily